MWHWEALLWEAGGELLTPDNNKAAFNSPAGLGPLNTLRTMAVTDKSMYLDPSDSAYGNLFNSGKIGMLVTGPWDLAVVPQRRSTACRSCPSYPGASGGHQTISGPGQLGRLQQRHSQDRPRPSSSCMWLTAADPGQVLRGADRRPADPAVGGPGRSGFVQQMNTAVPGTATFIANLANVKQARPQIAQYPKVSTHPRHMIVSVLLGKSQPQAALAAAAQQVDQALAAG